MKIFLAALVALLVAAAIWFVHTSGRVPDDPQPIAWDRETCAHCHMHIGDPRHAAQLVTDDGTVESFDDPGCAMQWIEQHHPKLHRLWFHGEGDRWIPADQAGFVQTGETPMASGLLAVDAATPGARPYAEVQP